MASWKESLKVGVPLIDEQHKQLCEAIDALLDACRHGKGRAEIVKTVQFLEDYTVKHFSEEQVLQKNSTYPKYEWHKSIHDGFIKQIQSIKKDIEEHGANISSVATLNTLLLDWLINHITVVDKELSGYLK